MACKIPEPFHKIVEISVDKIAQDNCNNPDNHNNKHQNAFKLSETTDKKFKNKINSCKKFDY